MYFDTMAQRELRVPPMPKANFFATLLFQSTLKTWHLRLDIGQAHSCFCDLGMS